jgi:two-component system, NarL family, sensor histidine kinase UhpB
LATVALVGGTAAGFCISRSLTHSVRRLVTTAQTIKQGDLSIQVEPSGPEELLLLSQTVNDMAASLDRSHRRLEQALCDLERSEAKYRRLTEEATDVVFTVDKDGIVTFVNQCVQTVAGYRPDEMIGQPLSKYLLNPNDSAELRQMVTDLEQAENPETFEVCIRTTDGEPAHLEVNAMPILENGQTSGYRGIARDITEKKRLEWEISRRTRELHLSQERQSELQSYVRLVTRAVEEERKRLARDLHDDTAQSLVVLTHRLDSLREELPVSSEVLDDRLEELQLLSDQILDSIRRFSRDLRPAVLDDLGLLPAIEWLLNDFNQYNSILTELIIGGQPRRLSPDAEVGLFRTAQEALNNVSKHAQATKALVQLSFGEGSIRLTITDNGKGFVLTEASGPDWISAHHMGLMGMRERAELLGGTLQINSKQGTGTVVVVDLPG